MADNDPFSLSGKTFLVAGGTRGIGRAVSIRFAEAGASVTALFVRNQDTADSLASLASARDLPIKCVRADLTRPSGFEAVKEHLDALGTPLSGMVFSAATGVHKPTDQYTSRDFKWVFSLNVEAFIELVNQLLPFFEEGAAIVALSSKGATRAVPSYGLVGASKGALEAYSRQLAAELAGRKIRVNILSPGAVLTDAWEFMPDRDQRLADAVLRTPLGRLVTPEEVAATAQFLCSDAGKGVVGHTLVVDGGAAIME